MTPMVATVDCKRARRIVGDLDRADRAAKRLARRRARRVVRQQTHVDPEVEPRWWRFTGRDIA